MSNSQMKQQAKELIRTTKPSIIKVSCVLLAITILFSIASFLLVDKPLSNFADKFGFGYDTSIDSSVTVIIDDPEEIRAFIEGLFEEMNIPMIAILSLLLSLALTVINAGFTIFCLRAVDKKEPSMGNLFDGFGMFLRIIWLTILQSILIFLWSLLFIIPGIIAFYRYRMALYLLLEHPELSVMECINESKYLMRGRKGKLFGLDLSFIGWFLLVGVANSISSRFGIAVLGIGLGTFVYIYLNPFQTLSYVIFYKDAMQGRFGSEPGNGDFAPEF